MQVFEHTAANGKELFMHLILLLTPATLMLLALAASPLIASGLENGLDLRGDWRVAGNNVRGMSDRSPYRNHAVGHGPLRQVAGRHGAALQFNGKDTWLEIPFSPALALKERQPVRQVVDGEAEFISTQVPHGLVIEVWLRPEHLQGRQAILGRYEEKEDQRSFRLSLLDGHLVFDHSYDGTQRGTVGGGLISEQKLAAGEWNQVIVSYDGRFISFMINGRRDAALLYTPGIYASTAPIQVGRHFDGNAGSCYFNGAIDEIRLTMPRFPAEAPEMPWEHEPLKRGALNNLVTVLLEEELPSEKEYVFTLVRDGWTCFSVTTADGNQDRVRLKIGSLEGEIVLEESNGWQAMRRLPAGRYRLDLSHVGERRIQRLVVKRVPELIYARYGYGPFDWAFLNQHVLHSANICVGQSTDEADRSKVTQWTDLGKQWIIERPSGYWNGPEKWRASYDAWRKFFHPPYAGVIADEFGARYEHQAFAAWTDAVLRLGHEAPSSRFFAYVFGLERFPSNHPFINAVLQTNGLLVWELYLPEQPDREAATRAISATMVEPMRRLGTVFPGIQRRTVICPSIWTGRRTLSNEHHPDVDFKVFLDMQFQVVATHPVFRDVAGIGPWTSGYADREMVRWLGALFRHYGIEGRTELLSERYGYSYLLDHLENAGFEQGNRGLDLEPAAGGAMGIGNVSDLPELVRQGSGIEIAPRGNHFLWMQRSAQSPNRMRQQIRNLTPGGYYSIKLYAADLDDWKSSIEAPHALSIKVAGGEIIDEECERVVVTARRRDRGDAVELSHYFIVFRASGTNAELEITDWSDEMNPGGPVGQRLYLDFLQVQPCYMGD